LIHGGARDQVPGFLQRELSPQMSVGDVYNMTVSWRRRLAHIAAWPGG
jgi:hypothetical protein